MKETTTHNFNNNEGIIIRWPKKLHQKIMVLKTIQGKFEKDRTYNETEANEIINSWHSFRDHALLRREMFENGMIYRTPDCRKYWI